MMLANKVVSREEWVKVRKDFLKKEKEFTRLRDELTAERQSLPMVRVEKNYIFEGMDGKFSLSELFQGKSQLVIYHFMFGPDWEEGCKSCSFWADNYDGVGVHLEHRDIRLITVSRAPLEKLEAYKKRMGWQFDWYSSDACDFNQDYQVTFAKEDLEAGKVYYNYHETTFGAGEAPGISVFYKDSEGEVYHTYSTYSRGVDMMNGAYHFIDLVPKGRNEADLPFPMAWLERHDQY